MYLRLRFNAFGENYNAKDSKDILNSYELKPIFDSDCPQNLSFLHPDEFSKEYWDEEYEECYYSFIKNNIDILKKHGADDFDIIIEVYKKELEQCNFEIFNKKFLKLIGEHGFRLPISVYTVFDGDESI